MTTGRDTRITQAIDYLGRRFNKVTQLKELASAAGISVATFLRQFKSATSMTLLQYQKQLRLFEARRLMINTNTNVETAAYEVGYESASRFSREYARLLGASPRRDVAAFLQGI